MCRVIASMSLRRPLARVLIAPERVVACDLRGVQDLLHPHVRGEMYAPQPAFDVRDLRRKVGDLRIGYLPTAESLVQRGFELYKLLAQRYRVLSHPVKDCLHLRAL